MRLTVEEVRELLRREESLFLEFKSLWEQSSDPPKVRDRREVRDDIAVTIGAFANAEGGTLVLGVEDDGTPTGHKYPEEALKDFARVPETRLQPALHVEMEQVVLDGKELLIFQVPASPEAVMVTGNGFPLRLQDQVVRESQQVINARKQAMRRVGFESLFQAEAALEHLDLDLAHDCFERTPHASRSVEENLERYRLVQREGRRTHVTNAALLLFAKDLSRWHPRAEVRVFRVAGTERQHGTERNVRQLDRFGATLVPVIEETHRFCSQHIRKSERLHDLFFREYPEYPTFAWQEAIVNAVAHRDYSDQGRGIEVWFYDDRMEVRSPGGLVQPMTLDDLKSRRGVHFSRNALLVRVLADAGIMREEGEGIPRMYSEMEQSFLRAPQFEEYGGLFAVTLLNTPILDAGSPEWQAVVNRLPISTQQKRVLLARPGGFTSAAYQELNGVNRDVAYREIQDLVNKEIVVATGKKGRGAMYGVSPELATARVWLEERVPSLRELFAGSARLTNADYRRLFGVERHRAVLELQKLRDAGVLEQRGEKRGSHYLPGPALRGRRKL